MKRFLHLILRIASVLMLFSFISCFETEEEDDSCSYDAEYEHYMNMVDAFNANPTENNCNNLKQSALDFLSALEGCADYNYYYEATQAWLDLDCSDLDDGGGGGGTGGGSGSGQLTFWVSSDFSCGPITVNVSNYSGTITSYYYTGSPGCNASGCANFNLAPGSYSFNASCSSYTWQGTVTVTEDYCYTMELTL